MGLCSVIFLGRQLFTGVTNRGWETETIFEGVTDGESLQICLFVDVRGGVEGEVIGMEFERV